MIFVYLGCIILLFYIVTVLIFSIGWKKIKYFVSDGSAAQIKTSIIIPFRNEEKNISLIINDLKTQSYPTLLTEIILINDHSTDNSLLLAEKATTGFLNFKIISLNNEEKGKKSAIKKAIHIAEGDLFIFTDADCRLPADWIYTLVKYKQQTNKALIIAPVIFETNKKSGIFEKLQAIEFMSLIASAAGASGAGMPFMCNAANLAADSQKYRQLVNPTETDYISGDDIFLLFAMKKNFKNQIGFVKSEKAMVITNPEKRFKDFVFQRIRWASKSYGYTDIHSILFIIPVLLINTIIVGTGIAAITDLLFFKYFLGLLILKIITDSLFLFEVSAFFKQSKNRLYIIVTGFFYPIYVVFIAILSRFLKFYWKGRKLNATVQKCTETNSR